MQRHEFSRLAEEFDSVSSSNDSVAQIRLDSEFNNLCMLAMGSKDARKMLFNTTADKALLVRPSWRIN